MEESEAFILRLLFFSFFEVQFIKTDLYKMAPFSLSNPFEAASFSPFCIFSGCGCKFCHVRLFKVIQAEPSDIQSVVFWHKKPYLAPTPLKKVSYFLNRMYNATEAIITGYCTIFVVDDGFYKWSFICASVPVLPHNMSGSLAIDSRTLCR